ncbi:hypothetical protein DWB64_14875 [Fusibacter sp. A1]|nr:hypothetical protein DWB64_14875 [Fusibacter sp. A1]
MNAFASRRTKYEKKSQVASIYYKKLIILQGKHTAKFVEIFTLFDLLKLLKMLIMLIFLRKRRNS